MEGRTIVRPDCSPNTAGFTCLFADAGERCWKQSFEGVLILLSRYKYLSLPGFEWSLGLHTAT